VRYIIEAPDGTRHVVEGPDTPAAPQVPEAPPSPLGSNMENFAAGMGQAVVKAGRGFKKLIDPLATGLETVFGGEKVSRALGMPTAMESAQQTDANIAEARRLDAPLDATKAGKAGNIAGNILLTAVPAAQMQRGLQGAMGTGKLATALAAGGAGAGTEFITNEGGLGDKAKAAAISGVTGAGLTGALGALSRPFRPSDDALKLYAQGVNPTLQQGADSPVGRFVGGLTAGAQRVKDRQRGEIADALVQRVAGKGTSVAGGTGDDALAAAQGAVSQQYKTLLKPAAQNLTQREQALKAAYGLEVEGGFKLTPEALGAAQRVSGATNAQGQMADEAATAVSKVANIIGPDELNLTTRAIPDDELYRNYLSKLNEAARETTNEEVKRRLLDAVKVLRTEVRDKNLTPEGLEALKAIDIKNFDVKRLEEAVSGAAGQMRGVSLSKLAEAYGKNKMAGNTTMQDLIGPAVRTMGKADLVNESQRQLAMALRLGAAGAAGTAGMTIPGAAVPLAALYGVSALGQTAKGAKALMGQTAAQKKLAELLRSGYGAALAPALVNMEGQ